MVSQFWLSVFIQFICFSQAGKHSQIQKRSPVLILERELVDRKIGD